MAEKWKINCSAQNCKFAGGVYESKTKAERLAGQHGGWPGHTVTVDEIKPLAKTIRVRDRIKIKPDKAKEIADACKRAGWDINLGAIRVVTRIDSFGPGGGDRLYVDGAPFMFARNQVELAWNSDDERRAGLGIRS